MSPSDPSPTTDGIPEELIEQLARRVHVRWMEARYREGWTYGPERNERARTLPGLVPYDELTEGEKDYDRRSAREALQGLLALGYRILPPQAEAAVAVEAVPAAAEALPEDFGALVRLWEQHDAAEWSRDVSRYLTLANHALRRGHPLLAYDVVSEALTHFPEHLRLRQLQARALANSGATDRANQLLAQLARDLDRLSPEEMEETFGLLARTHKDLWAQAAAPEEGRRHLERSFQLYLEGFRRTGRTYTGINAATLALLLGEVERSRALAAEVRQRIPAAEVEQDYYLAATAGEAALLLGDLPDAVRWYRRAAELGRGRHGDLASTRRNARMILRAQGTAALELDDLLPIPQVGVFLREDRPAPLAPDEDDWLRDEVRRWVEQRKIAFGYVSAATDAELAVAETLEAAGTETHVVLPFSAEEHRERLARFGAMLERFDRALDRALEVCSATEQPFGEDAFFREYAEQLQLGLARMHAGALDDDAHVLVLRDGAEREPGHGAGRRLVGEPARDRAAPAPVDIRGGEEGLRLAGILFADVFRYSSLTDRQLPAFVDHFLGLIARLVQSSPHGPMYQETWGDAVYFLFREVRDAGLYALELTEAVGSTDWGGFGLPRDMALRIGLHAGPVIGFKHPVTGRQNYTSRHTVRAARIEPITPVGTVYASREFAALAAAAGVREFACEPVGRIPLAKHAGTVPLFVLRRRGGAAR